MTALKSQIEELVGPAIQVNDEVIRACQEKNEFGGLSFALYRDATGLIRYASDQLESPAQARNDGPKDPPIEIGAIFLEPAQNVHPVLGVGSLQPANPA